MKNCSIKSGINPPIHYAGSALFPGYTITQIVLFLFLSSASAFSQSKWAFEQYNYIRQKDAAVFVPIIRFETKNNWHFETRYNYEDAQTISFFSGKTFSGGKDFQYTLTPMTGPSVGRFTGVSAAANTEVSWKKFYVWAQSQYSKAVKKNESDFFFNWSELGYDISDHLFTGAAIQYTGQDGQGIFEPGVFAGFSIRDISVPIYVFNPFRSGCYFVVGINYEYSFKKSK